ncbi:chitin synthase chs-1-like [Periophthalmus magnuspinnatus]|uniref:chitin synthase chs-1-like n=1 Tax=Periophthalmus magnuspinnatus TaxID=409849 RepID=UPI002436DDC1|nr:chitin synthase chs-1-like [Periophthalmus magnuspinnatus]
MHGFLYLLCIPSAYLLLSIYSLVNMNSVSWGTRETAPAPGTAQPAASAPALSPVQKAWNSFKQFFRKGACCQRCRKDSADEPMVREENPESQYQDQEDLEDPELLPHNTIVDDVAPIQAEPDQYPEPAPFIPVQCWVTQVQSVSDDMRLVEDTLESDEEQFFQELIVRYLEPVNLDKQQQQEMMDGLRSLRNKGNFVYFMINALWLVATFALQYRSDLVGIRIPKVNINLEETGEYMLIEPVGIMFILAFALLVFIQFIAMLWHRLYTLIHYISFLDTETEKLEIPKMDPKMETFEALKKVDDEESDDEDELFYPNLHDREQGADTMV